MDADRNTIAADEGECRHVESATPHCEQPDPVLGHEQPEASGEHGRDTQDE